MTIRDFHLRLSAGAKENRLFEALRKLTALDDPKQMASEEVSTGWIIWQGMKEMAGAC